MNANDALTLFPSGASDGADRIDQIYIAGSALCAFIVFVVLALVLSFCIRYRAGSRVQRPGRSPRRAWIELSHMGAMLIAFIALFLWSGAEYLRQRIAPPDTPVIYVTGKQWMWKIEHPEGRREINELHVPAGQPVRLILSSQDVIHSFFVPAFRIKQDAVPGRFTSLWFRATKPGSYHLFCAEYCGTEHSGMIGRVVVMTPSDYQQWLAGESGPPAEGTPGTPTAPLATNGSGAFYQLGCNACHVPGARVRAPPLEGLWSRQSRMVSGEVVTVDENYVRESILEPQKRMVAGYPAPSLMPSYQGIASEAQLRELVEFIKGLQHGWPSSEPGSTP